MTFEEFKALNVKEANTTRINTYMSCSDNYRIGLRTIVLKGMPLKTDEELKIEFARLCELPTRDDCRKS